MRLSSRPSRFRCWKCWSTMTPGSTPSPAAIWAMRCFGVAPDAPNAIMWLDIALAPALVPATTAPWRNWSSTASASRVPPIVDDSRSWLPPVRKMPRRVADREGRLLVVRLGPRDRVDRADLGHAELAEDLLVARAGLDAQRRRGRDHDDVRVAPARERGEPAQDDAVADLVLRAADDDDGSLGHDRGALLYAIPGRIPGRADRAVRECPRMADADAPLPPELHPVPGTVRGRGRLVVDLSDVLGTPTRRRAGVYRRAIRREASRLHDHRRVIAIVLLSLTFSLLAAGMIGRGEAAGADARAYWAGRPDLAQRRRPVPPDRPVPAVRLRPVDAAAVRAVGAPAVGRRLGRVARRDDPAAALDRPLGLPAPAAHDRGHRRAPRLPGRGEPRHGQHQPPPDPDAVGRPVHRTTAGRSPVGPRDLDEMGARCSSGSSWRPGPACWGWSGCAWRSC